MRRFTGIGIVFGLLLAGLIVAAGTNGSTKLNGLQIVNLPGGTLALGFGLIAVANAPSINTAIVATHDAVHANENYCDSSTGTTDYTCSLPNKALRAYSLGQIFLLNADVTCATTCTVNIDGLGPKTITKSDGVTAPSGTLIAGQAQLVWYDGDLMRLIF